MTPPCAASYTVDTDGVVFKIDPETGDISKVGDSGVVPDGPIPVSFYTVGTMADGSLFGIDYRQNLWRMDLKDGKAHLVGNTGLPVINSPHFGISLAGDEKYLYLTFEMSAPPPAAVLPAVYEASLLQIDPTTAKVTRIGRVPSFIGGSTLVGGKLYAFTSDVTMDGDFVGAAETLEIDLKTAAAKKLVVPAPCMGFGGFALPGGSQGDIGPDGRRCPRWHPCSRLSAALSVSKWISGAEGSVPRLVTW